MPVIYRKSVADQVIVIGRPINTVTTINAYGSADDYSAPGTDFGTDETIMVAGEVVAADGADLSITSVDIWLNGSFLGSAPLSYIAATGVNFYQFSLGMLAEGTYLIEARFGRLRI